MPTFRTAGALGDAIRDKIAGQASLTMLLARVSVTNATPIDTGHAMSNWVLSVGQPYLEVCGSREAVDFSAQSQGDEEVRAYSGRDLKARTRIYLRNNVPYLRYLDAGHSQQAPPNFIARALSSPGAGRAFPAGQRRAIKTALRRLALTAIKRGGGGRPRGFLP